MDSFELNKILGAVLGTCLFLLVAQHRGRRALLAAEAGQAGLRDRGAGAPGRAARQAGAGRPEEPIEKLLASASVGARRNRGQEMRGLPHLRQGRAQPGRPESLRRRRPRPRASVPGFNYSAAMKAKGGNWTIEELNTFLANPKAMVPGTTMSFAGLPRGSERADLIAYLNSQLGQSRAAAEGGRGPGSGPTARYDRVRRSQLRRSAHASGESFAAARVIDGRALRASSRRWRAYRKSGHNRAEIRRPSRALQPWSPTLKLTRRSPSSAPPRLTVAAPAPAALRSSDLRCAQTPAQPTRPGGTASRCSAT